MTGDDELMDVLRAAAAQADPVPDLVLRQARAALSTQDLDAELAELAFDSDLAEAGAVRAEGEDVRLLSFEAARVSVELQVEYAGGRVSLRGLITGATGDAVIEVAGERYVRPIGAEGWFTAAGLPRGATRVKVTAADGTAVTTGWASL
ncbi:hypothetical protein H4696_005355 [Amycolatopsis lexingtonensis]|uniref:Carboxypeptidase regulatory-like domain-containing protein n=1 Tax=Amycolatopsis lexingtonensis TaxID=218822 RepID=A0ABR9I4Z0_9PSEU|nr:hypothetical protein [Amycolatopsis lexingtonensis]MBE1498255.1 hypothetical protein [Amycolatopsis lexingtonensis]